MARDLGLERLRDLGLVSAGAPDLVDLLAVGHAVPPGLGGTWPAVPDLGPHTALPLVGEPVLIATAEILNGDVYTALPMSDGGSLSLGLQRWLLEKILGDGFSRADNASSMGAVEVCLGAPPNPLPNWLAENGTVWGISSGVAYAVSGVGGAGSIVLTSFGTGVSPASWEGYCTVQCPGGGTGGLMWNAWGSPVTNYIEFVLAGSSAWALRYWYGGAIHSLAGGATALSGGYLYVRQYGYHIQAYFGGGVPTLGSPNNPLVADVFWDATMRANFAPSLNIGLASYTAGTGVNFDNLVFGAPLTPAP